METQENVAGAIEEVDVNGEKYRVSVAPAGQPAAARTANGLKNVAGRNLPVWEDG
ncbi:MAG TPA: hypothetical protein VGM51_07180 [Armatimonadota bacterium]|jgi:hypothetical protein